MIRRTNSISWCRWRAGHGDQRMVAQRRPTHLLPASGCPQRDRACPGGSGRCAHSDRLAARCGGAAEIGLRGHADQRAGRLLPARHAVVGALGLAAGGHDVARRLEPRGRQAAGPPGHPLRTTGRRDQYPVWEFNNIPVTRAMLPAMRRHRRNAVPVGHGRRRHHLSHHLGARRGCAHLLPGQRRADSGVRAVIALPALASDSVGVTLCGPRDPLGGLVASAEPTLGRGVDRRVGLGRGAELVVGVAFG